MTHQEALRKAVDKAKANGYVLPAGSFELTLDRYGLRDIIFNHDFAKALWGEDKRIGKDAEWGKEWRGWRYHLQQMVIADDPLDYLAQTLEEKD